MFTGFSEESLRFLGDILKNNNKGWFEKNRERYEQHLLEPLRALVGDLGDMMSDIDPAFETRPAINKTISRIYRDTRFCKDKSPYRGCMWIVFKRPCKDWSTTECGYFFELMPTGYRYGMGFYQAAPRLMREIRGLIDEDPAGFTELIAPLARQRTFELVGDLYKKSFDEDKPPAVRAWYDRKNICLIANREIDKTLFSRKLVNRLTDGFAMLAPHYQFLRRAIDRVK